MIVQVNNDKFYMDGYLKSNFDIAKKIIRQNFDCLFVIDGSEGFGKSVLAMTLCYYVDPTFNINRICFNAFDFKDQILKADKYQAILFDEAFRGLSAREFYSYVNKNLIQLLAEIRQKNLFIFIVMPSFFDLDKYVALWRSRALIHVYGGNEFKRGFFAFYDYDKKKDLFLMGKKLYSYKKPRPNFFGRFTNFYPVNEEEYKQKKYNAFVEGTKKKERSLANREALEQFNDRILSRTDLNNEQKMSILNVSIATFYRMLKKYRDKMDMMPDPNSIQ